MRRSGHAPTFPRALLEAPAVSAPPAPVPDPSTPRARPGYGGRVVTTPRTTTLEVPTAHGPARIHLHAAPGGTPRAVLALGHGAGGGVDAPDLVAVTEVATALGLAVALVEQPYRVAGRRGSPRAPALDEAWRDVVGHLMAGPLAGLPLITGGRSA